MTARRSSLATVALVAGALLAARGAAAAERAIEDLRFTKTAGVASLEIVFACPVEYQSFSAESGTEVRVRLALGRECLAAVGSGLHSELHDPPRGNLAGARAVVFDTPEGRTGVVVVDFVRAQAFTVNQGRLRNVIRIELAPEAAADELTQDTGSRAAPSLAPGPASTAAPPRPIAAPQEGVAPSESPPRESSSPRAPAPAPPDQRAPPDRRPLRLVQRPVERGERFTIQLAAGPDAAARAGALPRDAQHVVYANEHDAGARRWQELRLGFFATEREAAERLAALRPEFPDALIAIAGVDEQDRATAAPLAAAVDVEKPAADVESRDAAQREAPALAPERVAALVAEADEALKAGDYDRSVQIYTRLLDEPGFSGRREARERLGVARERKGQVAQAKLEYDAYLAEFPEGPDAQRVRQRLAGLVAGANALRETLAAAPAPESRWDFDGGVAQYYRRDVYRPLADLPDEDVQTALYSNFDARLRRHGDRFEVASRVNAGYQYNLLDETESTAPRDQLYVSNAYVDVTDKRRDWTARVGRQTAFGAGVLGRFDGARVDWQWRPQIGLNLTLGRPIDYPRHAVDRHRQFVGVSADLDDLLKTWDFSFFAIGQEVDGIVDRQGVGAEARYRNDAWSVVTAVDVDPSYGVLNSALATASWRAAPKLTLNGRFNAGAAPFLTTHNALIGQQAVSVEELLETYSEPEIRRMARNRTAQGQSASLGLSRPVFDRFQLDLDVALYALDATVASAGVIAIPESRQTSLYLSFVGSSVIKNGDTTIFSLRHTTTLDATADTLLFDFRFAATRRLRLSPRLALAARVYDNGTEQTIVAPGLRLSYRSPRGHQFELEVGKQLADRTFAVARLGEEKEQSDETFFNAGYWWEL